MRGVDSRFPCSSLYIVIAVYTSLKTCANLAVRVISVFSSAIARPRVLTERDVLRAVNCVRKASVLLRKLSLIM